MTAIPYVAIGADELGEPTEVIHCSLCGEQHVIEYGTSKTLWVQQSAQAEELGMHRADVLAWRIDKLRAERDALLDAVTTLINATESICGVMRCSAKELKTWVKDK